ncbi:hypothetical protein Ami103574_11080 [Aminipila butyrica]|uniref:Nucleoside transporter/FeoB GTPase Gate domain-containing protein n=1 Tax=Aminipila butyrica TaxID=433296 RepID=A0A858BY40_9FIRM|nr:nucleoside recognition domain-containing protein [Aminipila butyrica]QIB69830.1 hypothetical protein Ami103574_11080 [Aminipila butyrica]
MNGAFNLYPLLNYIIWGDFGLLTMVPYFLLKILFPIITSFYLLQLFLLESNLLHLAARRLDGLFQKIGLSAGTFLPLLLGFGCVTVALGALQLHPNPRERRIAQILLCLFIPCSAQLVINTVLVFQTSRRYLVAYIILLCVIFLLGGFLLNKWLPGKPAKVRTGKNAKSQRTYRSPTAPRGLSFTVPRLLPLLTKALRSSSGFLLEMAFPFAIGNILVSILSYVGFIDRLCLWTAPVFCQFLKLPADAAAIFVLSIIKKDLGASSLLALFAKGTFTQAQSFICVVMLTLFVPCLASMIVLLKHESKRISLAIWLFSVFLTLALGKLLSILLILP